MAFIQFTHINDAKIANTDIPGVAAATVRAVVGRKSDSGDGEAWESRQDKGVGSVSGTITFKDLATAVTLLNHAEGDLVITGAVKGQAAAKKVTVKNAQFFTLDLAGPDRSVQQMGANTLGFSGVSTDGNIPLAVADAT